MNVIDRSADGARVDLSPGELLMINNALNETLAMLDDDEFGTRVGAARSAMEALLTEVNELLDRLPE